MTPTLVLRSNGSATHTVLRSHGSATHTTYSLSEPKHANTKAEGKDVNRSFDRTRLTTFNKDVETVAPTEICTLEALANIASELHDSSSDDIDLITTETLCDSASSNMDKLCNSKGSCCCIIDLTAYE